MNLTKNIFKTIIATALTIAFTANALAAGILPSDVEGLTAEAGDKKITIKWDAATSENSEITKYMVFQGTKSVQTASDRYDKRYDVGNVTEYEVTGLENDTRYYYTVIAFDAAGEHSENYSNEISAMPKAATADPADDSAVSPKVTAAEVINNTEVKIMFSKEVTLPAEAPEKTFSVKENSTDAKLEVLGAKISETDGKAVIITTEKQTAGAEYFLTVHSDLMDKDSNPIVSGTSDTASFEGSAVTKEAVVDNSPTPTPDTADTIAPAVKEVNVLSNTKIEIVFTEEIVLTGEKVQDSFKINAKGNELEEIAVKSAEVKDGKVNTIELETDLQAANTEYVITIVNVEDLAQNKINVLLNGNIAVYTSKTAEIADLLPPEDVTDFIAKMVLGNSVKLSWTASANTAKDLVDQILYKSTNTNEFVKVDNLGPAVTSYTLKNLTAGVKYTFKLTAKDAAGNESDGVLTTITLPETGAGIGITLLGTVAGMIAYHRRKKI